MPRRRILIRMEGFIGDAIDGIIPVQYFRNQQRFVNLEAALVLLFHHSFGGRARNHAVGLINSLWGLIIVYQVYTLPYCLWIVFGFIKALPVDFEEAATIDGASRTRILLSIVLPLTGGGLVATSIFSVIIAWNEFLFALLFIRTPALLTLPLKIVNFIGEYETLWGELMAVGILATLPILLFSGYVYKRLTTGFSMGLR